MGAQIETLETTVSFDQQRTLSFRHDGPSFSFSKVQKGRKNEIVYWIPSSPAPPLLSGDIFPSLRANRIDAFLSSSSSSLLPCYLQYRRWSSDKPFERKQNRHEKKPC